MSRTLEWDVCMIDQDYLEYVMCAEVPTYPLMSKENLVEARAIIFILGSLGRAPILTNACVFFVENYCHGM